MGAPGPFNLTSDDDAANLVTVNMMHPTYLSKVAMKYLAGRPPRSCILNVSSIMDMSPIAGYALYSASKAYINSFSSALHAELKYDTKLNQKIDCCVYCPGAVSTKLNGLDTIWGIIPDPLTAARTALHDVGRYQFTNGRLFDRITYAILGFIFKYWPWLGNTLFYKDAMQKVK